MRRQPRFSDISSSETFLMATQELTVNVGHRPLLRISLSFTQHFARHRCGIAFAQQQITHHENEGISFAPVEINVRAFAGHVAQVV